MGKCKTVWLTHAREMYGNYGIYIVFHAFLSRMFSYTIYSCSDENMDDENEDETTATKVAPAMRHLGAT